MKAPSMFRLLGRDRNGHVLSIAAALGFLAGCHSTHSRSGAAAGPHTTRSAQGPHIRNVICLYDQKPWINADAAGDLDPEGVQYRVFLDAGGGKGVQRDGTIHVEMYRIGEDGNGKRMRTLVSDWHYPTSQYNRVSARILGLGYHVQLRWAKKDIAGSEVEVVTQFEDIDGNKTRGATKRLRVPKFAS
jgi:hypothetical protein